jgi:hypothetical protein
MNLKMNPKIMLMFGAVSVLALAIIIAVVINGVFVNPKSGFNTIGNFVETIITSTLFSGASLTGFLEYMKLKTGFKTPQITPTTQMQTAPKSKSDHYRRHHSGGLPYLPPPPEDYIAPTAPKTEIEKRPYVTIDGQEPEEPASFFHTKKFYLSGAAFAIFAGLIAYAFIFSH